MLLSEILGSEEYRVISGSVSCNISSVEYDSRKIQSGSLFVAIIGFTSDGHGFISQAVQEINAGRNLKIIWFDEGVPFSIYGNALLKKSERKQAAVDVFNYIAEELVYDNNRLFYPEQIIKDFTPVVENYPAEIPYGNMTDNTLEEKERLLAKWTFS